MSELVHKLQHHRGGDSAYTWHDLANDQRLGALSRKAVFGVSNTVVRFKGDATAAG